MVNPDNVPIGFVRGCLKGRIFSDEHKRNLAESHKGLLLGFIHVHNGVVEKIVPSDCIPDGFTRGFLRKRGWSDETRRICSGRIRINNGIVERIVHPDCIPEGFVAGMLPANKLKLSTAIKKFHAERFKDFASKVYVVEDGVYKNVDKDTFFGSFGGVG